MLVRKAILSALLLTCASLSFAEGLGGFKVDLTLDFDVVQADRNTADFKGILKGIRSQETDTLSWQFRRMYHEQRISGVRGISTDNWLLGGRFERVIDARTNWYLSSDFERDAIAALNLRQTYAAGLTFKIYDAETHKFHVSGGVGAISEDFKASADTSQFSLNAGTYYFRKLDNGWTVEHFTSIFPAFNDLSDYLFKSDLGLTYSMNDHMGVGLHWLLDYDSTPATGLRKDRIEWILGVKYSF